MIDHESLLMRLKLGGEASDEELRAVAEALESTDEGTVRYQLLYILGLSGDRRYRGLLERYLNHREDPMLAQIALLGLCAYWNEGSCYRGELLRFVVGVDWDHDQDLQLTAVSIAGAYLRGHQDDELLSALVALSRQHQDDLLGEAADEAVQRAGGASWREILGPDPS